MISFISSLGNYFLDPVYLYLLIPVFFLFFFWLLAVVLIRKSRPLEAYGSKYPLVGRVKIWGFFIIAESLMIVAVAKPYLPKGGFSISRGDVEVIIVIDRSISMRAGDVQASRLDIARREAMNIESILADGDKAALFVFGRESHRKIYLTKSHNNVFERISAISFPKSLSNDGLIWDSDFASMLENIYRSMDRQDAYNEGFVGKNYIPNKKSNRIVILFSDGEDQFKNDTPVDPDGIKYKKDYLVRLSQALSEFRRRGLKLYPVGIGTAKGASWQSLLRGYKEKDDYPVGLYQDWTGKFTRLDRENLSSLARLSGADLTGQTWLVESPTITVRSYLKSVIDSGRNITPSLSSSDDESQLWQYFLVAAVMVIGIGIMSYPVSGYFRIKRLN